MLLIIVARVICDFFLHDFRNKDNTKSLSDQISLYRPNMFLGREMNQDNSVRRIIIKVWFGDSSINV